MKKIFLMFVAGAVLFAGLVYGGKYEEAVPLMDEMAKGFGQFVNALEKAGSADAVAAALNGYSDCITKISPKIEELFQKFPELKKDESTPEELKPFKDKMDKLSQKLAGLLAKMQQYMQAPVVEKAYKRWTETMQLFDDQAENEDD